MKNNPVSCQENLVVQELNGEVMIYDLAKDKAFCLNETSALVWQACDGNKSVTEISKFVSQRLNAPANEDLVWFALDQLKKEKLVKLSDETESPLKGLPRREAVKRIGLSSLIAIPVIASLVAPVSAALVSCAPANNGAMLATPGCPCTGMMDCVSNTCSGAPLTCQP